VASFYIGFLNILSLNIAFSINKKEAGVITPAPLVDI
jgi:hypothetical protein